MPQSDEWWKEDQPVTSEMAGAAPAEGDSASPVDEWWKEDSPVTSEKQAVAEIGRVRGVSEAGDYLRGAFAPQFHAAVMGGGRDVLALGAHMAGHLGIPGASEFADRLNRESDYQDQAAHNLAAEKTNYPIVADAYRGTLRTLPQMARAVQFGGPYGAIGMAAATEYSHALTEGKDSGLTGVKLHAYAVAHAAVEGGIETAAQALGMGGVKSQLSEPIKEGVFQAIKQAGKHTLEEIPQELLTELGHNAVRQVAGIDPNALSRDSIVQTAASTTLQSLMTGGAAGTPGVVHAAVQRRQQAQQPASPPQAAADDPALQASLDAIQQQYEAEAPQRAAAKSRNRQINEEIKRQRRMDDRPNAAPPNSDTVSPSPEPGPAAETEDTGPVPTERIRQLSDSDLGHRLAELDHALDTIDPEHPQYDQIDIERQLVNAEIQKRLGRDVFSRPKSDTVSPTDTETLKKPAENLNVPEEVKGGAITNDSEQPTEQITNDSAAIQPTPIKGLDKAPQPIQAAINALPQWMRDRTGGMEVALGRFPIESEGEGTRYDQSKHALLYEHGDLDPEAVDHAAHETTVAYLVKNDQQIRPFVSRWGELRYAHMPDLARKVAQYGSTAYQGTVDSLASEIRLRLRGKSVSFGDNDATASQRDALIDQFLATQGGTNAQDVRSNPGQTGEPGNEPGGSQIARSPNLQFDSPAEPGGSAQRPAEAETPAGRQEEAVGVRPGKVGDMLAAGQVVTTASGRQTTPFPKLSFGTDRKAANTTRNVDKWLWENAVEEARSRGDDFNLTIFQNENPKNLPQASKDAMEEYIFGHQPAVPPPFLKPLVPPQTPPASDIVSPPAEQKPPRKRRLDDKKKPDIIVTESPGAAAARWADNHPGSHVSYLWRGQRTTGTILGQRGDLLIIQNDNEGPHLHHLLDASRAEIELLDDKKTTPAPAAGVESTTENTNAQSNPQPSSQPAEQPSGPQPQPEPRVENSPGQSGPNAPPVSGGNPPERPAKKRLGQKSPKLLPDAGKATEGVSPGAAGEPAGNGPAGGSDAGQSELAGRGAAEPGGAGEPEAVSGQSAEPAAEPAVKPAAKPRDINAENHVIEPEHSLAVRGEIESLKRNIAAIELLKQLETDARHATPAEKQKLAQYTGWGGLSQAFDRYKGDAMEGGRATYYRDENWEKKWGKAYSTLKELLTEDEWEAARDTTINAHYTSRPVIEKMWDIVSRLGFTGGRVLEPGAGVGHFAGLVPANLRNRSDFTLVEMDSLSARIAQKLYPQAKVENAPLQNVRIAPGSVDLVVGNVPFAQEGPADASKRYQQDLNLHNYFLARALDAVRPGGLVVAISTHNTLDSALEQRQLLASKGDLVGAIRLPNDAFQENAKTEVVTDILVFRRPVNGERIGQPFTKTVELELDGGKARVNEYFAEHPEMVLGKQALTGTMYGKNEYTVEPTKGSLSEKLAAAIEQLPAGIATTEKASGEVVESQPGESTREGYLRHAEGKVQMAVGGKWVTLEPGIAPIEGYPKALFGKAGIERAKDYIGVRDAYQDLRTTMLDPESTDADVARGQKKMESAYSKYVQKHGDLNGQRTRLFAGDPEYYRALSLEDEHVRYDEKTGKLLYSYTKAPVFTKRTLGPRQPPMSVPTVKDGVWVSLGYRGQIDPEYVGQLTGKSRLEVSDTLSQDGLAFRDPATQQFVLRERYLSGNVKKKLQEAKVAAEDDDAYQANVKALEKVQPEPVGIAKISVRLGANWIPQDAITEFARHLFGDRQAHAHYGQHADSWTVAANKGGVAATEKWGTSRMNGVDILEDALNLRTPRITDKVATGEYDANGRPKYTEVFNEKETAAAKAKLAEMQKEFRRFIDARPNVASLLEHTYNDQFNAYVDAKYDGAHLELPGASADIKLRPYQKNAIWRILQDGYALLAHAVGAGKTYTMIGAAMEMRRLGLAKRPVLVVQNATLGQFATSFMRMYPNANVLVAEKDDLATANRQLFLSRITSGDWDAVVMAQSTFDRLSVHPDTEQQYIDDQLSILEDLIHQEGGERSRTPTVKDLVRARNQLQKQLDKLLNKQRADRDKNKLYFEDIQADALFLDEAHAYKKPFFITKLENLVGLNKQASSRGIATMMKVRHIQAKTGGKNVVLATGTPITNTLGEAWHMTNFVAPQVSYDFGVDTFDGFVGAFAQKDTVREMNAGGQWVFKDALVKFTNGPELLHYLRAGWDILSPDDLKAYMNENESALPELRTGKVQAVTVERTPGVEKFMGFLEKVYDKFKKLPGKEKRQYSYIPAVAYGAAKAAALDIRLVFPGAKEEPGSKVGETARLVKEEYDRSTPSKGAQLVFSDIFNPRSMATLNSFMSGQQVDLNIATNEDAGDSDDDEAKGFLYTELRRKLVALGIPASEIAIVGEANTDAKREALFERVKAGDVRVLIGSSSKMGVGVNVQNKLVALHHMDAPWLPADVEQREGRIVRFGNENKEVSIYRYAMKNTLDAAIFTKTVRKGKFIWQALSGKVDGREFEDPASELTMSVEEQLAAIEGEPLLFEKMDLDRQKRELDLEKEADSDSKARARETVRDYRNEVERLTKYDIPSQDRRVAAAKEASAADKAVTIDGTQYTEPKDIDAAVKKLVEANVARVEKLTKAGTIKQYDRPRSFQARRPENSSDTFHVNGYDVAIVTGSWQEMETNADGKTKPVWKTESYARITLPGADEALYDGRALSGTGIQQAADGILARLELGRKNIDEKISRRQQEIKDLQAVIETPWKGQEKLTQLADRLDQIEGELVAKSAAKAPPPEENSDTVSPSEPGESGDTEPLEELGYGGAAPKKKPKAPGTASPIQKALYGDGFLGSDVAPKASEVAAAVMEAAAQIQSVFAPQTRGEQARTMAGLARQHGAELQRRRDIATKAMAKASRFFESRSEQENYDFIDRMEHGRQQATPDLDQIAGALRKLLDGRRDEVRALGTGKLEQFIQDYFPHIWEQPDKAGQAFAAILGKRPLEGPKSFLKKRSIDTFAAGIQAGLTPVTDNPVDLTLLKIFEVDRYVVGQKLLTDMDDRGMSVFVGANEKPPDGVTLLQDRSATVYGAPTIEVPEYVNKSVWEALNAVATQLGVQHERKSSTGRGRLGYSVQGGDQVVTRANTDLSVLAHEIGHQLDHKYDLQGQFLKGRSADFHDQLRELADLHESKAAYFRAPAEKMAALLESYVRLGPERMRQIAPDVTREFESFLRSTPAMAPLLGMKQTLANEKIVTEHAHGGLLIRGHWYAPDAVANVFNNYLSPGLRAKSGLFRTYLGLANVLNQFQLGWSFFHLGFTSADAMTSKLAIALEQAAAGKPVEALKSGVLGVTGAAAITNALKGDKLLKEWLEPGSQGAEIARLVDGLVKAGGRVQMDEFYRTSMIDQARNAFKSGNVLGGLLRLPFALTEGVSKPVMEWIVPRQKLGVFADMASLALEKLGPNASDDQVREALAKAWDSADNRMGQVVYDNLFWRKAAKDIAMASVRSLGWNLGTFRELGGGAVDFSKAAGNLATGKSPELTHRMAYTLAMPAITALWGGILHYLLTGDRPEELKDYFYPKTGRTDEQGHEIRVSLPTYMKDVVAYRNHPFRTLGHKLHPAISATIEMLNNKDFYGTEIRNEDDPLVQQAKDVVFHAGRQFEPLAIRGLKQLRKGDASLAEQVMPFVGVVPAPASITHTPAEEMAQDLVRRQLPVGARTREQADESRFKSAAARRLGSKQQTLADVRSDAESQGITLHKNDYKSILKRSRETPLQFALDHLGVNDSMKVWEVASEKEREQLRVPLLKKIRANESLSASEKSDLLRQVAKKLGDKSLTEK